MRERKYKAYQEYRESREKWLGRIPSDWTVQPVKRRIIKNDGGAWGSNPTENRATIVFRSTEQTSDGFWKIDNPAKRNLSSSEKQATLLLKGDLLITKSSGSALHIGKTTLVNSEIESLECCYSNFMQRVRLDGNWFPKTAWYIFNNETIRVQFDYLSSTTTGLANLNAEIIGSPLVALPPLPEQIQIARFLDHETGKIDLLIEKQQELIALLKEKRQAVISHAVTKGLNPQAPLKDSGIEWLGQVPEHWNFSPLKLVVSTRKGVAFSSSDFCDKGIRVVKASDIKKLTLRSSDVFLPDKFLSLYTLHDKN